MSDFQLDVGAIRAILCEKMESLPEAKLIEREKDAFTIFRMEESANAAALEITINPDAQHFEFSIGLYIEHEGDYKQYPPTPEFVRELVHAVVKARISERRYYFFPGVRGGVARVLGYVGFESYESFRVSRTLSWLSPFALFGEDISYVPYRERV